MFIVRVIVNVIEVAVLSLGDTLSTLTVNSEGCGGGGSTGATGVVAAVCGVVFVGVGAPTELFVVPKVAAGVAAAVFAVAGV